MSTIHGSRRRPLPARRLTIAATTLAVLAALLYAAAPSPAATQAFSNTAPIQIAQSGPASPFPSSVSVSGVTGPVTDINVTFHRFGHARPRDVAALLVSPSGDTVQVMRLNCGDTDIEDFTWIFDQQASTAMPLETAPCDEFVYRPNIGNPTSFAPPAPAGPHGVSLDDFNGENPNGTWRLYVEDFLGDGAGDIEGGWTLTLSTGPIDAEIPGTGTAGPASPYPATLDVSGHSGLITDVNVQVEGIWHQRPDDLDVLLVGPAGQKVVLMSDACGSFELALFGWTWNDQSSRSMPDGDGTNRCAAPSYRPTDHEPGDGWPAPAPPGPYAGSLSAFDLTDPNGEWRMYVNDDSSGEVGFFTNRFKLGITTRPRAGVAFTQGAVELAEGATRDLTLRRTGTGTGALAAGAVTVKTLAASATADRDFTPISTTVTFAPGETERTVPVRAADDADREPDEGFVVAIDSAEGDAAAEAPANASVTIPGSPPADEGGGGGGGGAGGQGTPDVAPVLSRLRLSPARFAPRRSGPATFTKRTRTGTTIRYRLSEPAQVRFRLARRKRGRNRLLPGSFTHAGKTGANRIRFSGRLHARKLRPGAYRLLAIAADAGGSKSTPASARFRIVKPIKVTP